jgi:hypothetical protein
VQESIKDVVLFFLKIENGREQKQREEPKTALIEKVFILTFQLLSFSLASLCLLLGLNKQQQISSLLNGKSYFINF